LWAYSRAIRATLEHGGEIGRGHERVLAEELQRLLPERIAIRTGFVLGAGGTISRQLDLVLCDRSNYPAFTYVAGDLVVPDSVLAVISVKTSLALHDLPLYFREAAEFKALMTQALGKPWTGLYVVIAFWAEGTQQLLIDRFHSGVFGRPERGMGVDLIGAIDRGPICIDLSALGDPVGEPPAFVAHRAHVPGIAMDACIVESSRPFVDIYKLIVRALDPRLARIVDLAAPPPGVDLPQGVSHDPAYQAAFAGKSADLFLSPGMSGNFQMFYANVGTGAWTRGTSTESRLVLAGPRDHVTPAGAWRSSWLTADTYCAQTQDVVAPGQLAGYSFNVVAPADAALREYRFYARPAIAGIGALTRETRANAVLVVEGSQLDATLAVRLR
jgi:hypothetical protein